MGLVGWNCKSFKSCIAGGEPCSALRSLETEKTVGPSHFCPSLPFGFRPWQVATKTPDKPSAATAIKAVVMPASGKIAIPFRETQPNPQLIPTRPLVRVTTMQRVELEKSVTSENASRLAQTTQPARWETTAYPVDAVLPMLRRVG